MNYHCSLKYTDLFVQVQARSLYNCCVAKPERVDIEWLEQNPGKLFHTPTMEKDRKLMKENKPCESCAFGCFDLESKGLPSRRKMSDNSEITHIGLKNLQISLSNDCNLACMYCGPEFSSTWYRDIDTNGNYCHDGEVLLENNSWHKLWASMKQKQRTTDSRFFQLLKREITLCQDLNEIQLLGGEPLLHNDIVDIINSNLCTVKIITGLGVNKNRLDSVISKIKNKNVQFTASAESTAQYFDMLRNGIKWDDFNDRVEQIKSNGFTINFNSTISNISILDFHNFLEHFGEHDIELSLMNDRPFLMPHVLDDETKQVFHDAWSENKDSLHYGRLVHMMGKDPTEKERQMLASFLKQFSGRRSVDLGFLPKSLREWLGI